MPAASESSTLPPSGVVPLSVPELPERPALPPPMPETPPVAAPPVPAVPPRPAAAVPPPEPPSPPLPELPPPSGAEGRSSSEQPKAAANASAVDEITTSARFERGIVEWYIAEQWLHKGDSVWIMPTFRRLERAVRRIYKIFQSRNPSRGLQLERVDRHRTSRMNSGWMCCPRWSRLPLPKTPWSSGLAATFPSESVREFRPLLDASAQRNCKFPSLGTRGSGSRWWRHGLRSRRSREPS